MPKNAPGYRGDRYGGFQDTSGYDESKYRYGGYDAGARDTKANIHTDIARTDERSAPWINQTPQHETRKLQMGSLATLGDAAAGNAPSRAEMLGQQMSDRAMRSQMSAAGSVRGGPGAQAAAFRAASQGAASQRADMNQGIQAERANEMTTARGKFADATTSARGQDVGLATDQAKMDLEGRRTNDARAMEYEKMRNQIDRDQLQANIEQQKILAGSQGDSNKLNAGANESNAKNDTDWVKGIAGAGMGLIKGIGSLFSDPDAKTPLMGSLSGLDLGGVQPGAGGGVDMGSKGSMSSADVIAASTGTASDTGGIGGMVGGGGITGGGGVPGGMPGNMPSDMSGKNIMRSGMEGKDAVMLSPGEAKKPVDLDAAMRAGTEDATPYARDAESTRGVAGAERGYAASRAGQPGYMFGESPDVDASVPGLTKDEEGAPGTNDWKRYGEPAKKEGDPDWKRGGATKKDEKAKGKWQDVLNGLLGGVSDWASPKHIYVRETETSDPKAKDPVKSKQDADDEEETRKFMAGSKDAVKFEPQTEDDRQKAEYEKREGEYVQRRSQEAAAKKESEAKKSAGDNETYLHKMASGVAETVGPKVSPEERASNEKAFEGKLASVRKKADDFARPLVPSWLHDWMSKAPAAPGYRSEHDSRLTTSDPKAKTGAETSDRFGEVPDQAMAGAMRAMEASPYSYKDEFRPDEQAPGEVNVGPMANKMAEDPVARTAIVRDPETKLLAIDKDKGLKVVMGSLASLQDQIDDMNDVPRAVRAKKARQDGESARA
jgi:hypothetical protein